jgi:CHAD domain-containing protein
MKARQYPTEPAVQGLAIDPENVADGLYQLMMQRFDFSIGMLRDPSIPAPQLVHELRKSMKNIRAGLRLLSDAAKIDLADQENECAGIGRELSRLRDHDVAVETIWILEGVPTRGPDRKAWQRFETLLLEGRNTLLEGGLLGDEWRQDTVDRLEQVANLLDTLDIPAIDLEPFLRASGLARRKAHKALRKLHRDPSGENFHGLRKRSKRELYQRRLLASYTSASGIVMTTQLDLLCQELGRHQDLVVVKGLAESNGLLTDGLGQWLNSLACRLRAQTRALAEDIYL